MHNIKSELRERHTLKDVVLFIFPYNMSAIATHEAGYNLCRGEMLILTDAHKTLTQVVSHNTDTHLNKGQNECDTKCRTDNDLMGGWGCKFTFIL